MSEEKEFKWQVFLFILLAAVVVFIVGLILIVTGYNTYFNYLYYGDALLYTIFSAISYLGEPVPLIIVILILTLLIIVTFVLRFDTINRISGFTLDELVYAHLATQINKGITSYHAIKIYENVPVAGVKELPDYFRKPLFKHPYLFPYIISRSYRLFATRSLYAY